MVALPSAGQAATLTTVNLTPLAGTSWNSIASAPVRLNFGVLGMGSVTMTSVNGGSFSNALTPFITPSPYEYSTTLGSGDTLNSQAYGTGVFQISSPTANSLGGFNLTFTLDSGNFTAGSAFIIGSLDQFTEVSDMVQYFSPGAGFGGMDSKPLFSDFMVPMEAAGPGGLGTLYKASTDGISDSRAFQLAGAQNSFTIQLLQSPNFNGGISFSVAVSDGISAVPETTTWALMIAGFALAGAALRRQRVSLAFA